MYYFWYHVDNAINYCHSIVCSRTSFDWPHINTCSRIHWIGRFGICIMHVARKSHLVWVSFNTLSIIYLLSFMQKKKKKKSSLKKNSLIMYMYFGIFLMTGSVVLLGFSDMTIDQSRTDFLETYFVLRVAISFFYLLLFNILLKKSLFLMGLTYTPSPFLLCLHSANSGQDVRTNGKEPCLPLTVVY